MNAAARLANLLLAPAAVLALAHALARVPEASVDLSRAPPAEVTPALRERIARLDSEVLFTYAASAPALLPSGLRGVPDQVERLLRSIEAAGAGRVKVQIVDPGSDPGAESYLAAVGLAPFRARALEVDLEVDRSVWSALRIAYGPHGASAIGRVTPEILPGLQASIAAHLDLLEHPRRPRVALAAPLAYQHLRRELRERAEVLECDFELDPRVPEEADLFVWIDPSTFESAHLAALRAFLDRGGSGVIAGSARAGLPRAFGLAALDAILEQAGPDGPTPLVRSIPADQDFSPLAGGGTGARAQPNGALLFVAPTPFVPAAGRLRELGLELFPLASSSAQNGARSTLLALLAPDASADPRRGSLVLAASSSVFSDEYLRHEAFAHRELLSVLVASLASEERLALAGAAIAGPQALPKISASRQAGCALAVSLAPPLLLLAIAAARARRRLRSSIRIRAGLLVAGSAAVTVLLLARFAPVEAAADLTRARVNGLAPPSRSIVDAMKAPVRLELLFSANADLPPPWRAPVREARALAERFAAAGDRLAVVEAPPDTTDPESLAALARDGVLPLDGAGTAFAAIRIVRDGADGPHALVLAFLSPASFEHLEFRLANALARLETGAGAPRVALLASAPKLTPAEALEYEKRGLHPPGGGDKFGEARARLEANDFAVRSLDADRPEAPPSGDVLVCLEPRREAGPAIAAVASHLARGGSALLAAQHFGLCSRRLQANGLALAVRPEPWFPDVDRLYFPSIGIDLVHEVLLDEQHGTAEVRTEIEREPGRFEIVRERATSPLVVRATSSAFEPESPVARGISELLLECPNRLRVGAPRLAELGIDARAAISTSERAWSFEWQGGDLPANVLRGPEGGMFLGRQPLMMSFEGRFPPPGATPDLAAVSRGEARGRLLLLGCSQVFADESLRASGDAAQLLLNSVASLALPPERAEILAKRAAAPGIGLVEAREKLLWRCGIVGAAPAVLLLLGLVRARRRPRRDR